MGKKTYQQHVAGWLSQYPIGQVQALTKSHRRPLSLEQLAKIAAQVQQS